MIYRKRKDRIKWTLYIDIDLIKIVEKYKYEQKYYKSDFVEDALRYYIEKLGGYDDKKAID